ncbi:UDPGT domain-containing protein [Cephalotus follicularis]|uniref:Glycosyltransferase n=1 Tax=Cephalotus follicularis TaxID=3775 RepID=A0A1Q3C8B8_CEPFO|nr:UDPGT domain-containing protein [Cephalotus follicularis]
MGHLTPFLRLAASLVHQKCRVTVLTIHPSVSHAESQLISRFFSAFPQVTQKHFPLLPVDPSTAKSDDPFWLQREAIRRSAYLLSPLLSSFSPPLSALIYDKFLVSPLIPISTSLSLPGYIFFTSSARMCSLFASLSTTVADKISSGSYHLSDHLEIPVIPPIPVSSIPPLFLNPNSIFATIFKEDSREVLKSNGILINTFEMLEQDSLDALNDGRVRKGLPPVYAIGPLEPCEFENGERGSPLKWLNDQPAGSVVYVSFGSRTARSMEQIREIGHGLVRSGCRFLWVVKTKEVDRDEEEDLHEVLGHELMQKIQGKGLVVKHWVDQSEILGHKAVGGFLSHSGWNSSMEAAYHGVRMLAWPQHGDQKINAEVVEMSGLGLWVRSWGWGQEVVVKGEEIGEKIKEMMESESSSLLRVQAARVGEEARKAVGVCGNSETTLKELIQEWNDIDRAKDFQ